VPACANEIRVIPGGPNASQDGIIFLERVRIMFASSPSRPKRKAATVNTSELSNAKGDIQAACSGMHINNLVKTDAALIEELAELKRQKAEDDEPDNEKSCKAEVYDAGMNPSATGQYDSFNSIHAELNALTSYIRHNNDFSNISKIRITSPPCKSCAFVLKLLGQLDKVYTTKQIYKEHTGSWVWPEELQKSDLFSATPWNWVKGRFAKTGVADDKEIIAYMVAVIQNKSAL
jgi:deoxycytidylate deaminase